MFNANYPWMKDLGPFKEPWWYNAAEDALLPPLGAHHAGVFMRQPEILGLTDDDLTSKYNAEDARLAATTTALSRGWSRIDIIPDVGACIFAPTIEAANLSIAAISRSHQSHPHPWRLRSLLRLANSSAPAKCC